MSRLVQLDRLSSVEEAENEAAQSPRRFTLPDRLRGNYLQWA
jgi:hypothetical protein